MLDLNPQRVDKISTKMQNSGPGVFPFELCDLPLGSVGITSPNQNVKKKTSFK